MSDGDEVARLKAEANALLKSGSAKKAAVLYTKALKVAPDSTALLANRSMAFAAMERFSRAAADARACVRLAPTWPKGHWRLVSALERDPGTASADLVAAIEAALEALAADERGPFQKALRRADGAAYRARFPAAAASSGPEQNEDVQSSGPEQSKADDAQSAPLPVRLVAADYSGDKFEQASAKMPPVVVEFGRKTLLEVLDEFGKAATQKVTSAKMRPVAYFLPLEDIPLPVVALEKAFSEPNLHAQCCNFLRESAARDKVVGAMTVVQKSTIAYPEVWKRDSFPINRDVDGLFVTLESATIEGDESFQAQRVVHFVPLENDAERGMVLSIEKKVALDPDHFALMPRLLR